MNANGDGVTITQTPTAFLCQTHQLTHLTGRWRGAGNDVQHLVRLLLVVAHTVTPTARASWNRTDSGLTPGSNCAAGRSEAAG
jgi:hypothetical protein